MTNRIYLSWVASYFDISWEKSNKSKIESNHHQFIHTEPTHHVSQVFAHVNYPTYTSINDFLDQK
jgi:hypothetical protein